MSDHINSLSGDLCGIKSEMKLPELKVGTLDQLIQLSDELSKADAFGESVCRKVSGCMLDILDGDKTQASEHLRMNNGKDSANSEF
jgi:V-type H+-transporting ATPase subunit C